MKRILLFSTLLIMLLLTACQKEDTGIENDELLSSVENEIRDFRETINSISSIDTKYSPTDLKTLRLTFDSEKFLKSHQSCDGIEAIAALNSPTNSLTGSDIVAARFILNNWDANGDNRIDQSEFDNNGLSVLGSRMMTIAVAFNYFDNRDINYAEYEWRWQTFDCF